jgi:hypothetical protein
MKEIEERNLNNHVDRMARVTCTAPFCLFTEAATSRRGFHRRNVRASPQDAAISHRQEHTSAQSSHRTRSYPDDYAHPCQETAASVLSTRYRTSKEGTRHASSRGIASWKHLLRFPLTRDLQAELTAQDLALLRDRHHQSQLHIEQVKAPHKAL